MDIDAGSLVYAIAGRDKDGLFMVLKRDGAYVYIADGKSRKSESPKKRRLNIHVLSEQLQRTLKTFFLKEKVLRTL